MRILYVTRHFNHSGYLILERLIREGFDIAGVLLHDDGDPWRGRWSGTWRRLVYRLKCRYYGCPPLRTLDSEEGLARAHKLPIIFTDSIKHDAFHQRMTQLDPDIIVLGGGWHELIPERVFSYPRLGCVNTHPSLLPMFRGTSITRWQVLHGVERSGSTIHYVDDRFDTGGALAQREVRVQDHWSPQQLFFELGRVGADIMVPLLREFERHGRQPTFVVQHDERYHHYYKRWTWSVERLLIDWECQLRDIHFFVLANTQESYEYLGPHTTVGGKRYFLRTTRLLPVDEEAFRTSVGRSGLVVVRRTGKTITLHREGDPHMLELGRVQIFDDRHVWRRSHHAADLLHHRIGDVFSPERITP